MDLVSRLFSSCIALRTVAVADVDVWLEQRDGVGLNAGLLARAIRAARAEKAGQAAPPPEETDAGTEESVVSLLSLVGIVDKADKVRAARRRPRKMKSGHSDSRSGGVSILDISSSAVVADQNSIAR